MLQKNMKHLLLFGIMALIPFAASAEEPLGKKDCFQVIKISNPDRGQGEIDGLMPGGARDKCCANRYKEKVKSLIFKHLTFKFVGVTG